jgi:hypothetical protein
MEYSTVRNLMETETSFSFLVTSMNGVVITATVDDCDLLNGEMSDSEVSEYVLEKMVNNCYDELITDSGVYFTTDEAVFFVPYTSLEVIDLDCYLN